MSRKMKVEKRGRPYVVKGKLTIHATMCVGCICRYVVIFVVLFRIVVFIPLLYKIPVA